MDALYVNAKVIKVCEIENKASFSVLPQLYCAHTFDDKRFGGTFNITYFLLVKLQAPGQIQF